MQNLIKDFLQHLTLEELDNNLFRGDSKDIGVSSVFGGQLLGQALAAAVQTVQGRDVHSLHAYFLRSGDVQVPITYEVDRIRDGRSFTARRVVGLQHGRAIFNMTVSFQVEEKGIDHQIEMPVVPGPEGFRSQDEINRQILENMNGEVLSEDMRKKLTHRLPIEFRPVPKIDSRQGEQCAAARMIWFKTRGLLPDRMEIHKTILAYASDFFLLGTALLPHDLSVLKRNVQIVSIDHAMWFHRDFRADEWLLYIMDSPSAVNARGLSRGSIFSREGKLVALVAQEGVLRRLEPEITG